jgi:signal peptidase I
VRKEIEYSQEVSIYPISISPTKQMAISNKKIVTLFAASAAASSFLLIFLMFEGNHELYIVTSNSMVPTLNPGDAAVISRDDIDRSAFAQLKKGDIIIFEVSSPLSESENDKTTIIHRIKEIETDSGGKRIISTKGDSNPSSIQGIDYHITEDSYVGKVIYVGPYLGLPLMYINLLAQIVLRPIFYLVIGSVIAVAFLLEYKRKKRD